MVKSKFKPGDGIEANGFLGVVLQICGPISFVSDGEKTIITPFYHICWFKSQKEPSLGSIEISEVDEIATPNEMVEILYHDDVKHLILNDKLPISDKTRWENDGGRI